NVATKLNPSQASDFLSAGKVGAVFTGIITGNFPVLAGAIGTQGATMMTTELLLNPRFQNLAKQMGDAVSKNRVGVAKNVLDRMVQLSREIYPEGASTLQQIDVKSLLNLPKQDKSTEDSTLNDPISYQLRQIPFLDNLLESAGS